MGTGGISSNADVLHQSMDLPCIHIIAFIQRIATCDDLGSIPEIKLLSSLHRTSRKFSAQYSHTPHEVDN